MSSSSIPVESQYHHFIPRFILRNFAHPYVPPSDSSSRPNERGKIQRKNGHYPGDAMLHAIDLSKATAELIEIPVARTFGLTDMYRDFTNAANQHYLEHQLSTLESRVGGIISKIRKSFESGAQNVWITRPERDTVRKFLFIMKYRGSAVHKRFYHQSTEGYSSNDREKLLEYMRKKGYQKPIDVWFDNIKAMLELKMDSTGEWREELKKHAYPDDAKWFIMHEQAMYLALCTPSGREDEFVLTENGYSIREGPVDFYIDPVTGETKMVGYTEFHVFAVISPKLIMVLRSFVLPVPEEDFSEEIRVMRTIMFQMNALRHSNPLTVKSMLEDLPVTKARNSYTRIVNGRLELLEDEDGLPRSNHRFCFHFFPISAEHVNKINTIMLEESYKISKIVFKSQRAVKRTLEYYLSMPCNGDKPSRLKMVGDGPNDLRLVCLKKLEHAARLLGSNITLVYQTELQKRLEKADDFETLGKILARNLPQESSNFMNLYLKLGGTATMIPKDMDQAARMQKMRIKIDVWTRGLDEIKREAIRENVRILFCKLPKQRVWFYLKRIRNMLLAPNIFDGVAEWRRSLEDDMIEGPEDVIVNTSHLIRGPDLSRLMFFATMNHIHLTKHQNLDLTSTITLDESGAQRLYQAECITFGGAGSICDCGISAIEEKARQCRQIARTRVFVGDIGIPFWTDEENVEMDTRILVRKKFSDLLQDSLSLPELKEFERVLFNIVYPTIKDKQIWMSIKSDFRRLSL